MLLYVIATAIVVLSFYSQNSNLIWVGLAVFLVGFYVAEILFLSLLPQRYGIQNGQA